jgi:hypothetical protein
MLLPWFWAARAETVCGDPAPPDLPCDFSSVEDALAAGASELELLEGAHRVAVTLDRPVTVLGRGAAGVIAEIPGEPAFVVTPGGSGSTLAELERLQGTLISAEGAFVELRHVLSRARGQGTLARVSQGGLLTLSQPDIYDFSSPPGQHTPTSPLLVAEGAALQVQSGVLAADAPLEALLLGVDATVVLSHTLLLAASVERGLSLQGGSLLLFETELVGQGRGQQALWARGSDSIGLESVSLSGFQGPAVELDRVVTLTLTGGELADNAGPVLTLRQLATASLQGLTLRDNRGDGVVSDGVGALRVDALAAVRNEGWALAGASVGALGVTHSLFCANGGAVTLDSGALAFTYNVVAWDGGQPPLQGAVPSPLLGNLMVDELPEPPALPASPGDCLQQDLWPLGAGEGPCPDCVDEDGDLVRAEEDCDDTRADVFPGATDLRGDGVDQDCDGQEACWEALPEDGLDCDQDGSLTPLDCDDDRPALGDCSLRWRGGCAHVPAPSTAVGLQLLCVLGLWASARARSARPSLDTSR